MKSRWERAGLLLLVALRTGFCCYRAVHQSLTTDEAFSFQLFIDGPWARAFGPYNANNHVLFSFLSKLSIHLFGVSEFALRLPSILAGAAFVLGVFALLQSVRSPVVRWIALVALALHPLVLDFSVAARGYGLAIAFLVWGIHAAMRGSTLLAGVLLGLAVSANLTMAFPALAVLVCSGPSLIARVKSAVAAALVFAAICVPLLRDATPDKFYAGLPTLASSALEITWGTIRSIVDSPGLFGRPPAAEWIVRLLLPLLIVGLSIQALRREFG